MCGNRLDPETLVWLLQKFKGAKSLVVRAQTWNMGSTPAMGTNWSIHVYHLINLLIVLVVLILNSTAFTDSKHGWAWDIIWFGFRRSHMTQDGPNAVRQGMMAVVNHPDVMRVIWFLKGIDLYELWHCYLGPTQVLIELPVIHHNFDPFGNFWC